MQIKIVRRLTSALALAAVGFLPTAAGAVLVGRPAPEIAGSPWINSKPLTIEALKGRAVLIEFWTYG
jgi:hypothetical protein